MKIAELFAEVGFKFDTIKLKEVSKTIGDLNLSSVVSTAAVVKLGDTIKNLMVESVQASNALTILGEATGLDTDYIQRFEKLSLALGSTKEEADSFLATIGKLQLAISQGRGDATPFVLLGINPMGKTKEELNSLIAARFRDENFLKEWAKRYASNAKSTDEIRAELKRQIGGSLNISDSMLRVFSSKDFDKELDPSTSSFPIKTKEEIRQSTEALAAFVKVTQAMNTEFQRTVDVLLPAMTDLLNGFKENGGLKALTDGLATVGRAVELLGISVQYMKAAGMNINSALQQPLINARKLGNQMRGDYHVDPRFLPKSQTNNITLTVHSNTPEEFVRKFEPVWKKYILNADTQFGQQT